MRSDRTASTNTAHRFLLYLRRLLIFVSFVPGETLGKGGTNMHEGLPGSRAAVPTYNSPLPNEGIGGCGRGRYRDPRTHKCRGPADLGN